MGLRAYPRSVVVRFGPLTACECIAPPGVVSACHAGGSSPASESGSNLHALHTLRENRDAFVFAKRLECVELAPALGFASELSEARKRELIRN